MKNALFAFLIIAVSSSAEARDLDGELQTTRMIQSQKLARKLRSSPGVPSPLQAEYTVLNYMEKNRGIFDKKTVLDIGTGNGIIALYAAKLGATKVIATDINPTALEDASFNARELGLSQVELRKVPEQKPGAYEVIKDSETFDVIVSNPPYTLDLEEKKDGNFSDSSLLGASIISGLDQKLKKDGVAILLYRNLFYHLYLAELARSKGFQVKSYVTDRIPLRELEMLFNSYAEKLSKNLKPEKNIRFDFSDKELSGLRVTVSQKDQSSENPKFSGLLIISKSEKRLRELDNL